MKSRRTFDELRSFFSEYLLVTGIFSSYFLIPFILLFVVLKQYGFFSLAFIMSVLFVVSHFYFLKKLSGELR
jgi:hypothetical protein